VKETIEYAFNHSINELLQKILDEAENFTGSKVGFYHFISVDQEKIELQTWSTNTKETMCKVEDSGLHYPISQAGDWVDCMHEGKAVIHNNYATLPHKKGMREGHAPIIRELLVPIIRNKKVIAILGLGKKIQIIPIRMWWWFKVLPIRHGKPLNESRQKKKSREIRTIWKN